ncbi:MAG: hypothetical protein WBQ34_10010 [Candidatus Acidiferrales bacterium]
MKLRHIAALALVGWYLMVPPIVQKNGKYQYDYAAPLSKWTEEDAFDTASDCKEDRETLVKASKGWGTSATDTAQERCIATDDPRLKEK